MPLARTRLVQARDTINNTIQEIRNYLVGLRAESGAAPTLATPFVDHRERLSGVGHRGPDSGMRMKGRPR